MVRYVSFRSITKAFGIKHAPILGKNTSGALLKWILRVTIRKETTEGALRIVPSNKVSSIVFGKLILPFKFSANIH